MSFFGWCNRQLFCGLYYKPKKEAIVQSTDGNIAVAVDTIDKREAARWVRALPDTVT